MSPESEFLKNHDIQEVFENEMTVEFIPENVSCVSNCTGVADADYASGMQEGFNKYHSLLSIS